jgi:DNA-binding transcriptional LysR family regulator
MTVPNLRHLGYFVAAAEAGSMSAAAEQLHVSQSAVSMALADLERRLGVQLLLRHRAKGLTLTTAGRHVLPEARALLARAEDLTSEARDLGGSLSGRLVVGCFQTIAPFVLPPLLQAFGTAHPDVRLDFVENSLAGLQRALVDGECEAALLYDLDIRPGITTLLVHNMWPHVLVARIIPSPRPTTSRLPSWPTTT